MGYRVERLAKLFHSKKCAGKTQKKEKKIIFFFWFSSAHKKLCTLFLLHRQSNLLNNSDFYIPELFDHLEFELTVS